ncbi:ATP-dependent zinc metalloprotease FtsH [Candidatus Babeliales bacterium]|nr:ATP-dependent zinc metalloprotease FtsH [Candidatus Babeliales bacterium]
MSWTVILGLVVLGLLALVKLNEMTYTIDDLSYSSFLRKVEKNEVKKVNVSGKDVQGTLADGSRFETVMPASEFDWDLLRNHGVEVALSSESGLFGMWSLVGSFAVLLLLLFFMLFFRQGSRGSGGNGGAGNLFAISRSKAKMFMPSAIKVTFKDVAGVSEAKEELQDVIDYLKSPDKYRRLGAKMTKGVLLVGGPGTGKTLLARAVAGEANCPFFSISGSDFIEVFVGVGAARVRDLFSQARKHAPCIVFIDEIDAVGRHRGSGTGGGNDEREQTLNQLLTEMDGFDTSNEPIIVIAATNRPDVLDRALLRPGRFDRRVDVPLPDLVSREQILQVHAKNVKIADDIDFKKIARGTPGFTGADLENLINEAAIAASKKNSELVSIDDFEEARDKILLGKELKTISLTEEDRKMTAYHEAGHALVQLMLPEDTDPLHKVSIIPRGRSLGVTHSMPEREKYTMTKREAEGVITVAMGGRVAETLVFDEVATGAANDFEKATDIARSMVVRYGMSGALGTVHYSQQPGEFVYSQKTAELIDTEVRNIIDGCYQRAKQIITDNRDKLETLAAALLEKETLQSGEIYELLDIKPRQEFKLT